MISVSWAIQDGTLLFRPCCSFTLTALKLQARWLPSIQFPQPCCCFTTRDCDEHKVNASATFKKILFVPRRTRQGLEELQLLANLIWKERAMPCMRWARSCTLVLNLGIASAGIRVKPGQTETRFCLYSFLKLISLFSTMHISTFVLMKVLDCSRELHEKYLWALAISLKYYSRFGVCFGTLLWKIVECVCLYMYGERGLLLIVPLWGCQTVWPHLFYCKWKGTREHSLRAWTRALLGTRFGSSSVSLKNHLSDWILFAPRCYK